MKTRCRSCGATPARWSIIVCHDHDTRKRYTAVYCERCFDLCKIAEQLAPVIDHDPI